MPRRRNAPAKRSWEARGDLAWKWLLRVTALGAFLYVLIAKDGNVPMGVYVIIGGFAGLPHVISLQQLLNNRLDDE